MKIVSSLVLREVAHQLSQRHGRDNPMYNKALLDLIELTVGSDDVEPAVGSAQQATR